MADTQQRQGSDPVDEQTVRVARRRFARRQWARRWLRWRGLLAGALLATLVAGGVWLVYFSSALAVSGVVVDGADLLPIQKVVRTAAVDSGEPLATVDLDAVTARVENLAPVRYADVSRAWPDQVRIVVVERQAVAVVARDGDFRGLDENGVLFRDYRRRPDGLPLIRTEPGTRSDALAEAAQVVAALPGDLLRRVEHVEVETMDAISLQLRRGDTVFWGSAAASGEKARVLEVLLGQRAEVYDVSVPGQPTLRR